MKTVQHFTYGVVDEIQNGLGFVIEGRDRGQNHRSLRGSSEHKLQVPSV